MLDLRLSKFTLRLLWALAMGRALLRFCNPRRRSAGRNETAFYVRTWREAAEQLGGSCRQLTSDVAEIQLDGARTRVVGNVSEIDDPVTLAILHDKPLTHRLLAQEGLPVPRHATFSMGNLNAAMQFLRATAGDCVVKPANGTGGGRGVTTGIRTRWQLARATAAAAVYSDDLMIEQQIPGENYRLLFLDGKLLDAYSRRLPSLIADGKSSIARLVRDHNEERLRHGSGISKELLSVDLDMKRTLSRQGLALRSIPPAGTSVTLKTVVNENSGADNTTATDLLCRSIIEDCARAVRALRVRFAGIDVITRDPSVSLAESGGVILEINGTPNLYFHYMKSDGAFPAAVPLLRRLLAERGDAMAGVDDALREVHGAGQIADTALRI
jgi:cyanophycin synthetase